MSNLKNEVIRNFIQTNPTSKEIDFLLYIARYQDTDGVCRGIYYKDTMEAIECCKQTFYSIKNSLEKKGIIKIERASKVDYDITIIGNQENWKSGYLSARKPALHSQSFKKLPAGAKMIALDLLIIVESNGDSWDIAVEKFLKRYGVTDDSDEEVKCVLPFRIKLKTLQEYIRMLKHGIELDENNKKKKKNNKGIFIFRNAKNKDNKPKLCIIRRPFSKKVLQRPDNNKTDNQIWTENIVESLCRRNNIETDKKNKKDVAELFLQYRSSADNQGKSICQVVMSAFYNSLEKLKKKILYPELIHNYIKYELFGIPLPY